MSNAWEIAWPTERINGSAVQTSLPVNRRDKRDDDKMTIDNNHIASSRSYGGDSSYIYRQRKGRCSIRHISPSES